MQLTCQVNDLTHWTHVKKQIYSPIQSLSSNLCVPFSHNLSISTWQFQFSIINTFQSGLYFYDFLGLILSPSLINSGSVTNSILKLQSWGTSLAVILVFSVSVFVVSGSLKYQLIFDFLSFRGMWILLSHCSLKYPYIAIFGYYTLFIMIFFISSDKYLSWGNLVWIKYSNLDYSV